MMPSRSFTLVSMISRTKNTTSSADAVFASPRKSISRCTTLPATSGNLTAHEWIACRPAAPASAVRARATIESETGTYAAEKREGYALSAGVGEKTKTAPARASGGTRHSSRAHGSVS